MKKCKEKIPNYRPSIILYTLIEELRVVKGLLTYLGFLSDDFVNIVTGNFNCIMNTKMDKLGGNPNARHSAVLALMTFLRVMILLIFGRCVIDMNVILLGLEKTPLILVS